MPRLRKKEFSDARLIATLVLICMVSAGVLAAVQELTRGPIAEARRQEKLKAIRAVLPPYANEPDKEAFTITTPAGQIDVYPGRDAQGNLVGMAIPTSSAEGYGGVISLILGVNVQGEIQAMYVLEHKETPGLGDNITKPKFQAQFIGKSLATPGFVFAVKKDGGSVDAITGATISSRAVTEAIKDGLETYQQIRSQQ